MKKICVVTATRAEYGLLKNVIKEINIHPELELCLIVTGAHLSGEFGYTVREIEEDGFPIAERVDMLMASDEPAAVSKSMGVCMISFADVLKRHNPDLLVVLGDRYELISVCSCALNMRIPIAHISGGEITTGAIDDCIRHCITKMSNLHFPGCEAYRHRIIQLGENPASVFNYGDVGVESILKIECIGKAELEKELHIKLNHYACVTFHPVTTQLSETDAQMDALLDAMSEFPDIDFIITKANADAGGARINQKLEHYVSAHANCKLFASLGIRRYLSILRGAIAVIGNSSSGIVEAPVLKIPTVNIGDRQKGRLQAESIFNCKAQKQDIADTMAYAFSSTGQDIAKHTTSPYKADDTANKIVNEINRYLSAHTKAGAKKFYDVQFTE